MIDKAREHWDDAGKLSLIQLEISDRQLRLAEMIGAAETSSASAFLSEKESGYKVTDSMARAKSKTYTGGVKTSYQFEFYALSDLLKVITVRISALLQMELPAPELPESSSASTSE